MSPLEAYYENLDPQRRDLAFYLREVIMEVSPLITERFSWKIPFFYAHTYLCYISLDKPDGLYVGFSRGKWLPNAHGILEMKGRKQISSVHYKRMEDVDELALRETVEEAMIIDREWALKKKIIAS